MFVAFLRANPCCMDPGFSAALQSHLKNMETDEDPAPDCGSVSLCVQVICESDRHVTYSMYIVWCQKHCVTLCCLPYVAYHILLLYYTSIKRFADLQLHLHSTD